VTVEELVMVAMPDAERAATVSVLAEVLTAWWAKHASDDRIDTSPAPDITPAAP
jgi:hypothetical protein